MQLLIILLFTSILSADWAIDTTYSYIKYTGNHPLHSWTGISKNINFKLDCHDGNCIINISTPLEEFSSGNDSRDSNMLYYTESLIYPVVSFKSDSFRFNQQFDKSIDVKGVLNFHGIDKEILLKIALSNENSEYWGICNFNFYLNSFDIDRPSLLMLKISDVIEIETRLKLIRNK